MQKYSLTEALNILQNGYFHSVAYVSANRNKNEGGKIIRIKECQIIPHEQDGQNNIVRVTKDDTAKKQNHSVNATRNLHLRNGSIRKMHLYAFFSLNNCAIV